MDIAEAEDNLSGACSESTDFIMEIGLQSNWHNEVNQKVSAIYSGTRLLFIFFLNNQTSTSFEIVLKADSGQMT